MLADNRCGPTTQQWMERKVSVARAHHYVPQVYLKQWAVEGRVAARRRGESQAFVASTAKIMQERDLYTIEHPDMRKDAVETSLSRLEGEIPEMLQMLRMGRIPAPGTPERKGCAELLALQYIRTPDRLILNRLPRSARVRAGADGIIDEALVRELFVDHVGREPLVAEIDGLKDFLAVTARPEALMGRNDVVAGMFGSFERVASHLRDMSWSIERTRGLAFITSDTPVHVWCRRPPQASGVGIANADEVRFPVGPRHLLVLRPHSQKTLSLAARSRVESVNRHTMATSWQVIAAQPNVADALSQAEWRPLRPLLIARSVKGVATSSGTNGKEVDLLHLMRPYDDGTTGEDTKDA